MRSRSVVQRRLASNWRARASSTRVMAAGRRPSIWRSIRASSFSQSLMARNAMREEVVSKSRTLSAASRAMRQPFRARRARSSTLGFLARAFCLPGLAGVRVFAGGMLDVSAASGLAGGAVLRGMGQRNIQLKNSAYACKRFASSLALDYERTMKESAKTIFAGRENEPARGADKLFHRGMD